MEEVGGESVLAERMRLRGERGGGLGGEGRGGKW